MPASRSRERAMRTRSERTAGRSRGRRRTTIAVVAFVLLLGIGGTAIARAQSGRQSPSTSPVIAAAPVLGASPSPSATTLLPAEPTLVLGDSLGLTVYPYLADLLPDRYVSYTAKVGSTTDWALQQLTDMQAAGTTIPRVVVVSSGTNDQLSADFQRDASAILTLLGSERCVVWSEVSRPLSFGDDPALLNADLAQLAAGHSNLHVVGWHSLAADHPEWFGADGIHPDSDGARARASAFAAAVTACSPLDPTASTAPKQVIPQASFY